VYDSYNLSEMDPGDLAMIRQWELEAKEPYNGHWHINANPHKPGTTWRECRHRNTGCLACVEEMEADGTNEDIRKADELWLNSPHISEEQYARQEYEKRLRQGEEDARREKLTRIFWDSVRRKGQQQ